MATTFSKAAVYMLSTDFIYEPVDEAFSAEELAVLGRHRDSLELMLRHAHGGAHSVGAARLTARFDFQEHVPLLWARLRKPGIVYGWEGQGSTDEQQGVLDDSQFVYHAQYLRALEEIAGQPLHRAVHATPHTLAELRQYASDPSYPHVHWARWLLHKLQATP